MVKHKNKILFFIVVIIQALYIKKIINYIKNHSETEFTKKIPVVNVKKDYFYFLQITDTHLSRKFNKYQDKAFEEFLKETENMNYEFIIHTGDIFDSQDKFIGTRKEEYVNLVKLVKERRFHFIRGNHDIFKTTKEFNQEIAKILYNGSRENRNIYLKVNDKLILIRLLDGTPEYGTPKFYNFFGIINEPFNKLNHDLCINMCHYPTNVLKATNHNFKKSDAWFCGHFHSFFKYGNIFKNKGQLECVLRDFYSNSIFRIIAIYKGNLTFNDVYLKKPKVVILNPVDKNLGIEKINEKDLKFLAFGYKNIRIFIDDKEFFNYRVENELHTLKLPTKFSKISVEAENEYGQCKHEINVKTGLKLNSFPLAIPFFNVPYVFVGGYLVLLLLILHFLEKNFFVFVIRNIYNAYLPTMFVKAHDNNFIAFTATKAGMSTTFDVFYFHTFVNAAYDFILAISFYYHLPIIFCIFHIFQLLFFYKYYGYFFRPLEDFFFVFLIISSFYKYFVKKQTKKVDD
ncbi:hypothetical protein H312_02504 [Anncaliia algerae PRA339]|uniref:Calcineurin-like phosphoesterase domain-containing protein n=1 Tax=Anncaliia algerae PRA339 TaxID=1288291 RepID=A0A059EYX8_9MICR|nr:hypothetical protein H312_02504 [Anncaliia algerae PRA339]